MAHYSRIFAALDGGPAQEAVARRAVDLAAENGADLLFGHVIDALPTDANGIDFDTLCKDGLQRVEASLAGVLCAARENPSIPSVDVQVRAGRVTEALADELIAPFNPDLVVCGERGLSNIKYVFVGSVSTFLIRNMRCDVLVVKQS